MAAAPIDLSGGLVPKPIDLSAGLVPKAAPPAPQSLWEKAKSNFNANTQGAQHTPGESNLQRLKVDVQNFGAGGGDIIRSIAHPLDTIGNAASQAVDDVMHGTDPGIGTAVRMGQAFVQNPARTAGQVGTGMILGKAVAPVVDPVLGAVPKVADAALNTGAKVADTVASKVSNPYPTSQSVVPKVSAARNLAKALVVTPEAAPNFIRAATDEAGTIVGYAKDNNLPINSKVDFANAAKAAADTVQTHFDDAILKPNADTLTAVPNNYRGVGFDGLKIGESPNYTPKTATLGEINNRIDAINQELNPNFRKGLASQTSAANVSDADLIAEKRALTNILHTKLAAATGLEPSEIAAVRQQAGKLRSIADEANLSANRDMTGAGKQAMGTTTSAVGTKAGIADRVLQAVQGGPEIIGNRQINLAVKKIQPQSLTLPQPTSTGAPPPPSAPPPANIRIPLREQFIARQRLREVTGQQ